MTPLFAAIVHGCAAEGETGTLHEVYRPRISRGNDNFAAQGLGLYGQELAALAAFFETPFTKPSRHLSPGDRALALNKAGFRLRALGRLEDAAEPMRVAAELPVTTEEWERASSGFGTLSELLLTIGHVAGEDGAVIAGEEAVVFADRSGDAFQRMSKRTTLADALAQAGGLARAEALFARPKRCRRRGSPTCPALIRCGATDIAISSSPAAAPPKPPLVPITPLARQEGGPALAARHRPRYADACPCVIGRSAVCSARFRPLRRAFEGCTRRAAPRQPGSLYASRSSRPCRSALALRRRQGRG